MIKLGMTPFGLRLLRDALEMNGRVESTESLSYAQIEGDLGLALLRFGQPGAGLPKLRRSYESIHQLLSPAHITSLTATRMLAEGLMLVGQTLESRDVIDAALESIDTGSLERTTEMARDLADLREAISKTIERFSD